MNSESLRARIYKVIEPKSDGGRLSTAFDIFIMALILLNVLALILESVPEVGDVWASELAVFELVSVLIFTLEYGLRIWVCVEDARYASPFKGRIRYLVTPYAIIDLIAIAPFFLPFVGVDMRFVRSLRIMRLARVAKLARYTTAVGRIKKVILAKRDELVASLSFMVLLIIVSSCLLYYAEHDAQPEQFASIPATMWWSIVTLTTVGYGDIYPVTVAGKMLAAVISLLGIGMVALPTSILGAGFIEEARTAQAEGPVCCRHCGKPIETQSHET